MGTFRLTESQLRATIRRLVREAAEDMPPEAAPAPAPGPANRGAAKAPKRAGGGGGLKIATISSKLPDPFPVKVRNAARDAGIFINEKERKVIGTKDSLDMFASASGVSLGSATGFSGASQIAPAAGPEEEMA